MCLSGITLHAQLVSFNFFGQSSPTFVSHSSANPNVNVSTLTRGVGAAASPAANSFRTVGFSNNGISTANSDYFQVSVSVKPGFAADFTSLEGTFAGSSTFSDVPGVITQFAYSIDGTNFTLIGSPFQVAGNPQTNIYVFDPPTIATLRGIAPGQIVTFRFYASGQTSNGEWGFFSPSGTTGNFIVNGTAFSILPLAVSELDVVKQNGTAKLGWSLTCTANSVTYEVQRSSNGINFETLLTRTVDREDCSLPFSFVDVNPAKGQNYYRIMNTSIDGEKKLSNIGTATFSNDPRLTIFPTVTTGSVNVNYESALDGNMGGGGRALLSIMDVSGRVAKQVTINTLAGNNRFDVDMSGLPKAVYYVYITNGKSRSETKTIIKM